MGSTCEFRLFLNGAEPTVSKNGWYQMRYEHFQDTSEYKQIFIDYMAAKGNKLQALDNYNFYANSWLSYGDKHIELNCMDWLRPSTSCPPFQWQRYEENRWYFICNNTQASSSYDLSIMDQFTATQNNSVDTNYIAIYSKCTNDIGNVTNNTSYTTEQINICSDDDTKTSQKIDSLNTMIAVISVIGGCICLFLFFCFFI